MRAHQKKIERLELVQNKHSKHSCIGTVVAFDKGQVFVDYQGNGNGPLIARVSSALDDDMLAAAARIKQEAFLFFEDDDPARPVLVTLLRSATPLVESILVEPLLQGEKVARVDGRRVLIEGKEEVVLRCGEASLTLQRDGKAILRGINVVSEAKQVQKIRGGKVRIN